MDYTQKDNNELPLFPGLIPYPHTVGAPAFKPTESGAITGKSYAVMKEQVGKQREQIFQQLELLKKQYEELENRVKISEFIYTAEVRFTPDVGNIYFLYSKPDKMFLSLISPNEWNNSNVSYVATVKLLSDLTWEVLHKIEE